MDKRQENIIKYSEEILDYLLKFKESNPDFTFPLRKKDSVQSKEERLEKGHWFQGSDYILVPLFKKGDNARKIKTIGFQIVFDQNGNIKNNFIEISFKAGVDDLNEIQFHRELSNYIDLELNEKNHGLKEYPEKDDVWNNLKSYITSFRTHALKLLEQLNLKEKYLVSEIEFQKDLNKIIAIKEKLQRPPIPSNPVETVVIDNTIDKAPLNQILYGPPGTGKTYATKELAVNIVSPMFIKELDSQLSSADKRKEITKEYDRLFVLGQIVFTTFHQSMSYEEFIEGIKPETTDGEVTYDVKKGIFRKLCIKAEEREIKSNNFEELYRLLLKEIDISDSKSLILETLIQSKEFTIYKNSKNNIKFHANTEKAYEGVIKKELLEHYLKTGEALDWPSYVKALGSYIQEKYKYQQSEEIKGNPVVLIIDEINRGNVSAIFGELITVLEEDKRIGKNEELRIKLPYSKEPNFGVPSNLYIIGTMNTADRSVEALDTALRRRFSFSEIMPKPELLEEIQFNDFNLAEVLQTINDRIEVLLDRDHTIGHSYFLKIKNGDIDSLKSVFKNNIFPLLQEYFYHDYQKIALILGEGFVRVKENQTVKFATFKNIDTPEVSTQYELVNEIKDIETAIQLLLNRNV